MSVAVTGQLNSGISATLSQPVVGVQSALKTPAMTSDASKSFGTSAANNALGGADTVYGPTLLSVGTSSTTTLTLSDGSLKDNLGNAIAITAGHVKGLSVRLLSAAQTSPDGTAGNACSGITLQGDCLVGAGRPVQGSPGSGGTATKLEVKNGCSVTLDFDNGTGYAVTGSSTDVITITNEDGANAAKVMIALELAST